MNRNISHEINSTATRKDGHTLRYTHFRKLFALLFLTLASVGAWAADYVLTYTNGGTTYYLARNGTTGVTRVNTFNPTTCIWSCETAAGAAGTLNNSNTYGYLYQTVNGTKYYLYADVNAFSLKTDRATNNYSRMRTNGTYVYNRYSNTYSYYINLANNAPARATTASNTCARPYQVTTNSVAVNNNGITAPTISCSGLSGDEGILLSRTGVGGSYIPAHTTYAFNNQTIYYYNNTAYTNTNQFAVSVNANDATYNWSVTAGTANVSTTGVVTLGNNNTQNVTVRCRATINGVNKDATYTLNATRTDALNETAYGDISITPSSQTLDLEGQVTYTVSPSISQVTRTRSRYVTITDEQGHTHYKVDNIYQASEPTVTETPGSALSFTQIQWSFSGGNGQYYQPSTTSSQTTTELVLTRNTAKTATTQVFTITATGRYGGWSGPEKTATATVTIPLTRVDLTNLYPGEAINLSMGENENINGHYTYQPNDNSAGAPFLSFRYTSNNTSVATVDASGKVTAVGPGSTTITVTAVKLDGTDGVTCNVTVNVAIDAPTISIDGSGNVIITHPVSDVQIRYTTDGSNPTATTGTVYNGAFGPVANETTVKAVAVANSRASAVSSGLYATSGVSGTKVILNDYEDHNWTYYQPNGGVDASYAYPDQLCSPYPRNVKITYLGNGKVYTGNTTTTSIADNATGVATATGVQVSRYETENTFVYYKTLERDANDRFPYELIPNPFSKRPTYGNDANAKWRGFYGWRIKSVTGGTIYDNGGTQRGVGYIFTTEYDKISFQPTDNAKTNANNATSMEVEFEAVWARAYRVVGAASNTNGNMSSADLAANSYERNFVVVTSGTSATNLNGGNKPCTVTMIEPDGSQDYRTNAVYLNPQYIMAQNSWKFEWINLRNNNNNTTISANGKNLVLGRGLMQSGVNHTAGNGYGTPGTNLCAAYVNGLGNGTSAGYNTYNTNLDFVVRIESGFYTEIGYLAAARGRYGCTSALIHVKGFFGNDYDRAAKNNARLISAGGTGQPAVCLGDNNNAAIATDNHQNYNKETLFLNVKSGLIGNGTPAGWAPGNNGLYLGSALGNAQTCGNRQLLFEGGRILSITGGMDRTANNSTAAADNTAETVRMRFKGTAEVLTAAYGGAAQMPTYGKRILIYTGGLVHGWTATGCNGIAVSQGQNRGIGYMYVGGNTRIGDGTLGNINGTGRGIVMGAGNGRSDSETTGEMTHGSYVVVADKAEIENEVYGGGNYGYTLSTAHIYITGGTVNGSVFGGSLRKQGDDAEIYMTGGEVKKGIYGGSNTNGTFSGSVTMHIDGGVVGSENAPANIHGGGYGQPTRITKNIDITIGKLGATNGATIYGDVYGGSALGYVNGTAATSTYHTKVTLNSGVINGSLYGGALGSNTVAANVYGPVTVTVNGGILRATDQGGLGAVFGCNNINGRPQRTVNVNVAGGTMENVYGGGNMASYSAPTDDKDYPKVFVCNGTIEQSVFGGGLGSSASVSGNPKVKIGIFSDDVHATTNHKVLVKGGVYGGGSQAAVEGSTRVTLCTITNDTTKVTIKRNVFGGGEKAYVRDSTNVLVKGSTVDGYVYGGGSEGNIGTLSSTKTYTKVIVDQSQVKQDVFGGGLGAPVYGNTAVWIKGENCFIHGSVLGGGFGGDVTGDTHVQIGGDTDKYKKCLLTGGAENCNDN